MHAHCHIPEALALMDKKVEFPALVVGPERVKAMDEQGIDIEALSINPLPAYHRASASLSRR